MLIMTYFDFYKRCMEAGGLTHEILSVSMRLAGLGCSDLAEVFGYRTDVFNVWPPYMNEQFQGFTGAYDFKPICQNMILFLAAMNGEFDTSDSEVSFPERYNITYTAPFHCGT